MHHDGGSDADQHARQASPLGGASSKHPQEQQGQEGTLEEGHERLKGFEDRVEVGDDQVGHDRACYQKHHHQRSTNEQVVPIFFTANKRAIQIRHHQGAGGVDVRVEVREHSGQKRAHDHSQHTVGQKTDHFRQHRFAFPCWIRRP